MRSVRTEETEKTKQTFAFALEENYPPLPGYTGHIPKVYKSSVVGRSVASATRRVREKAVIEQKAKQKSQSVERYQEQTASSRAKQVRHVRTQHQESTHMSKTQTSSVSKVVHHDEKEELITCVEPNIEPKSDQKSAPENIVEENEPTPVRLTRKEPREEISADIVEEIKNALPAMKEPTFPRAVTRDALKDVRPKSAVDNLELAGRIKCDDCDDASQHPHLTETSKTRDTVDTKTGQVPSDYYRSAVSVKESFYQSVIARTTRYESQTVAKKNEVKESPSSSKDKKPLSPKKSAELKTTSQTSPKKPDSQAAPKTSPKKSDLKTILQTSPKKSDSPVSPKTSPKKSDSKTSTKTSPKKSESQSASKMSPKKMDSKAPVQTSPKKLPGNLTPNNSEKHARLFQCLSSTTGYIPGLMFQYGRTFAKAAEDCVVTFLRQQEEKVYSKQVEVNGSSSGLI
ncbi:hypothetical protein FHG87_023300 [Trinorchestia longiramus]|nr:hypothetical protein FHG87_023300 [Trinorchestia longiramus]